MKYRLFDASQGFQMGEVSTKEEARVIFEANSGNICVVDENGVDITDNIYDEEALPADIAISISFTDERNNPVSLSAKEIKYFYEAVNHALSSTGINIPVYIANHELYTDKHADALGIHYKAFDGTEEFITIDAYFIRECYREKYEGWYNINNVTLIDVICHELAHIKYRRHTKYHAELTKKYIEMCA